MTDEVKPRRLAKRTKKLLGVLRNLRNGSSISLSCKNAGITASTFWVWRKREPRIADMAEAIADSRIQLVEDALFTNCLKGNVTAQIFFLTNRASAKWADRRALVNNTNVFNAKSEAMKYGGESIESTLQRIDDIRRSLVPPSDKE